MSLDESALDRFYSYAELTYDTLKKSDTDEVIFHFVGDLNQGYANAISAKLESLVETKVPDKQAQKRFYTVYIEAIQNIRIHGLRTPADEVIGGVTVTVSNGEICARFLNFIPAETGKALESRYARVNAMDRGELKKNYMDQMMNGDVSRKGGAGLGIITIVLRSQKPSQVKIVSVDHEIAIFESNICVDFQSGT